MLLVSSVSTIARTFKALEKMTLSLKSNGNANGHVNGSATNGKPKANGTTKKEI